ncbi:3-isopropylmalate dehydratase small subunit [Salmonella enterica subsp. enterica serovar Sandiego]|nr:3-isopropylmalate dehydratase small subunit [Salmonella enterica subsp. enterica serovar Sandiego]
MEEYDFTLFGNNINTDDIISGRFLRTSDITDWKEHIFEDYDPNLKEKLRKSPLIVAGAKFGCGSSREQAVLALKMNGIKYIMAITFGKIFYRNCINHGISPITISEQHYHDYATRKKIAEKELLAQINFSPLVDNILTAGGLISFFHKKNLIKVYHN